MDGYYPHCPGHSLLPTAFPLDITYVPWHPATVAITSHVRIIPSHVFFDLGTEVRKIEIQFFYMQQQRGTCHAFQPVRVHVECVVFTL